MAGLPSFGFTTPNAAAAAAAPVAAQAPAVQQAQPQFGTAVPASLMALGEAKVWDGAKAGLPCGNYVVRLTCAKLKNTQDYGEAFIPEYAVEQSDNEVPAGTEASEYFGLGSKQVSYLANWMCDVLGVNRSDKSAVANVQKALPYLANAAVTGVPTPIPGFSDPAPHDCFVGHSYRLQIVDNGKVVKSGKNAGKPVFDKYWSRVA